MEPFSYRDTVERAGFVIDALREVTEEDPQDPWYRIPLFLHLRAARP